MPEVIKRHYELTTLRITLLADDDPPAVLCDLEITRGHLPETVASWKMPTTALGLPSVLDCGTSHGMGYQFKLPTTMTQELSDILERTADPGRPLWLHLAKPYGNLGLVPWEQLLVPRLPVPVLRLPDFVVEPIRSRSTITIVLCANAGTTNPTVEAAAVAKLAAIVVDATPLPTTVHVFTTASVYERLLSARSLVGSVGHVLLHDPVGAATAAQVAGDESTLAGDAYSGAERAPVEFSSTDTVVGHRRNVWLTWMRDVMCGQSVDVVHFVAPAVLRLGQGALALSNSPVAVDDPGLVVVSTADLTRFTMQVGAWASVFSSPVGNPSEMGLRLVAVALADLQPTIVLHHEVHLDPGYAALAAAYRLITSPVPGVPPNDPSVFLYCQPFQVVTEPRKDELLRVPTMGSPALEVEPSAEVRSLLADADVTPTWISASQRFVEQYQWRLQQWGDPTQPPVVPEELSSGVARALHLIQDVMGRYAQSPPSSLRPTDPVIDITAPLPLGEGGIAGPRELPG